MYEVILLSEAGEYLDGIQKKHRAKAEAVMRHLAEKGPNLHRPHADTLRGKIRELRCGIATFEHRFLYFFDSRKIIVTHGFLKKTDKVPEGEIAYAERVYGEYFSTETSRK